jgi:hypothetical protein
MSTQNISLLTLTVLLTGAVAAARFVTPAGAQAAAGGNTLGVARSPGAIGERIPVDAIGTAVVEAGAAVAAGASIGADASGRAITWASGAKVAIALEAATAAGQFVEVLLIQNVA